MVFAVRPLDLPASGVYVPHRCSTAFSTSDRRGSHLTPVSVVQGSGVSRVDVVCFGISHTSEGDLLCPIV